MSRSCVIGGPSGDLAVGSGPLVVIAGPCAIETEAISLEVGEVMREACAELGFGYVFKASFDKANRTSPRSPRGPGIEPGLDHLATVRERLGVPVTTDVHAPEQAGRCAEVVDVLQIPAFLCRQTDLLLASGEAAASRGRAVNIKKGQFLSPGEMLGPVAKVRSTGCERVLLTERGTFFGYQRLVNDFVGVGDLLAGEGLADGRGDRPPVVFDATHSVQLPGVGETTGGRRERIPLLARAAVAAGVDAVFLECHPDPASAPSDGTNMLPLDEAPALLRTLGAIRSALDGASPGIA